MTNIRMNKGKPTAKKKERPRGLSLKLSRNGEGEADISHNEWSLALGESGDELACDEFDDNEEEDDEEEEMPPQRRRTSSTHEELEDLYGHKVGDYVLEKELTQGAFSSVFKGKHKTDPKRRSVVLKQLLTFPVFVKDATHEFEMTKMAANSHVVPVLDLFIVDEIEYLVFEYAEKGDLYEYLNNGMDQENSTLERKDIGMQCARAIATIHNMGIVHCDIKLENFVLTQDAVKLCDFGVSGMMGETRTGKPFGTTAYMAPELTNLRSKHTKYRLYQSHDNWSLGILFFALVMNDLPWDKCSKRDPDFAEYLRNGVNSWKYVDTLSEDMKSFFQQILCIEKSRRMTAADVVLWLSQGHPWYATEKPTLKKKSYSLPKLNRMEAGYLPSTPSTPLSAIQSASSIESGSDDGSTMFEKLITKRLQQGKKRGGSKSKSPLSTPRGTLERSVSGVSISSHSPEQGLSPRTSLLSASLTSLNSPSFS
eukprot:m.62499 g.62499  ORF g.62499 m.62499 type:complete len:481 (+) comp11511_c0_seq2:245-1687(+)